MFGFLKGRKPKHHFRYTCACCGEVHEGPPSFSAPHPPGYAYATSEDDASHLILDTEDWCVIAHPPDTVDYFIRATLEIPIDDCDDVFLWGIWVTQSKESFERYHNTFGRDQSGDQSFGWLFADLAPYLDDNTTPTHLACNVCWQAKGTRPKVTLQDADHPMVADQRNGISQHRAAQIASQLMHG